MVIKWWYARGWGVFITKLVDMLRSAADFFSISLLVRTLFAPFKQIDANKGGESLAEKFQAFIDRLVSRIVGAIMRLGLLIFGLIALILESVIGFMLVALWPLVPFAPIAGAILTFMQVTL